MTRRLVFRPEADLEINEAAEWYEARGQGLAVEFLRVLDACIESIRCSTQWCMAKRGERYCGASLWLRSKLGYGHGTAIHQLDTQVMPIEQ